MNSAVYRGWIRHRRRLPVTHGFRYRAFLLYLDLDELTEVFAGRRLWSADRPALAWFRRSDHVGDPHRPLGESIRDLVAERTGRRPSGPVRLLTNLRYFGYCFNPVSFYYCFAEDGRRLEAIAAEVTNTPWNERHVYVLPMERNEGSAERPRFRFAKDFHVSPFMGMDVDYDWRFTVPGSRLVVHMDNRKDGRAFFDATMVLDRRPVTGRELARCLVAHPFMTGRVFAAIHWQALLLWLKRCPVHPHPGQPTTPGASP